MYDGYIFNKRDTFGPTKCNGSFVLPHLGIKDTAPCACSCKNPLLLIFLSTIATFHHRDKSQRRLLDDLFPIYFLSLLASQVVPTRTFPFILNFRFDGLLSPLVRRSLGTHPDPWQVASPSPKSASTLTNKSTVAPSTPSF